MNNENDTDVQEEDEEKENIIIHCLRKILCISEKECLDQFDSTKINTEFDQCWTMKMVFKFRKKDKNLKKLWINF